jgi:hypothetical protein
MWFRNNIDRLHQRRPGFSISEENTGKTSVLLASLMVRLSGRGLEHEPVVKRCT